MLIKITYELTKLAKRVARRLTETPQERYLSKAVDLVDFERRLKAWERSHYDYGARLQSFGMFNH